MVSTEDQADKTVLGVTFLPADLTPFKDRDTSISCNKEADIFFWIASWYMSFATLN